jgi:hypothetical protein
VGAQGAKPRQSASAFTVDHFSHYILARRAATCAATQPVAVAQVASMYAAKASYDVSHDESRS